MTASGRSCGCCPYCGALPGHQDPPSGEVWQHRHSPVRERMADSPARSLPSPVTPNPTEQR